MTVIHDSRDYDPAAGGAVVGVGFFDGFHRGHTMLLDRLLETAGEKNAQSLLYTYQAHPDTILRDKATPLLMSMEGRLKFLENTALDVLCLEAFTEEYAGMTAEDFIVRILLERFHTMALIAGFNYTFGRSGSGNADTLRQYGERFGFEVHIIPPVYEDGEVISSTLIREFVSRGDIIRAARMLGRPYFMEGIVSTGRRIGRKIGFPTANIRPDPNLVIPARGVYMTATCLDGEYYGSVTNVGMNPTVNREGDLRFETHILQFDREIYQKKIRIFFIRKIRDEMVFSGESQLAARIADDVGRVGAEWEKAGGVKAWSQSI